MFLPADPADVVLLIKIQNFRFLKFVIFFFCHLGFKFSLLGCLRHFDFTVNIYYIPSRWKFLVNVTFFQFPIQWFSRRIFDGNFIRRSSSSDCFISVFRWFLRHHYVSRRSITGYSFDFQTATTAVFDTDSVKEFFFFQNMHNIYAGRLWFANTV